MAGPDHEAVALLNEIAEIAGVGCKRWFGRHPCAAMGCGCVGGEGCWAAGEGRKHACIYSLMGRNRKGAFVFWTPADTNAFGTVVTASELHATRPIQARTTMPHQIYTFRLDHEVWK